MHPCATYDRHQAMLRACTLNERRGTARSYFKVERFALGGQGLAWGVVELTYQALTEEQVPDHAGRIKKSFWKSSGFVAV